MFNLVELKGRHHVFNLNNGKSLRLYARQSKPISDTLAESPEIASAVAMGHVSLVKVVEDTTPEITKNPKGGKK